MWLLHVLTHVHTLLFTVRRVGPAEPLDLCNLSSWKHLTQSGAERENDAKTQKRVQRNTVFLTEAEKQPLTFIWVSQHQRLRSVHQQRPKQLKQEVVRLSHQLMRQDSLFSCSSASFSSFSPQSSVCFCLLSASSFLSLHLKLTISSCSCFYASVLVKRLCFHLCTDQNPALRRFYDGESGRKTSRLSCTFAGELQLNFNHKPDVLSFGRSFLYRLFVDWRQ